MILRKEKEDSERATTAPVVSKPDTKRALSDDSVKKLAKRDKEIEVLKEALAQKDVENNALQGTMQTMSQRLEQASQDLERLVTKKTLTDLRQAKSSLDELKRKHQKAAKDWKDERHALVAENAQLTQRQDELQSAAGQSAQLKKQLAQTRDRLTSIAHEYEERQLEREATHDATVKGINQSWQTKLDAVMAASVCDVAAASRDAKAAADATHAAVIGRLHEELHLEKEENVDLLQTVKSLQDKLVVLQDVAREAELAKQQALVDAQQARDMCTTAEDAADACESHARKYKEEGAAMEEQLHLIDNALKLRGISIDFLLKKANGNNNNNNCDEVAIKKDKGSWKLKSSKPPSPDSTTTRSKRK
ncbi:hypothetical protein DYB37_006210 [Aphanomyces astaci]|uniref:Uncharacterized protein n=1 Tax=Aphanomyces astaci TaxID=112090 RepID=A0A3R7BYV5_APHAT|nr:hypothetical protein DYB35_004795 [Aphanomyces astaci]RHZ08237.1 hypothetical protein DYB37_006210 [Aphanomyces astaci]